MGLIAAPSCHAYLTPLLVRYVHRLVGVPLLLGGYPGSSHNSVLHLLRPFRLLDHDHLLLLCRIAMMAQAVGGLNRPWLEVIVSG